MAIDRGSSCFCHSRDAPTDRSTPLMPTDDFCMEGKGTDGHQSPHSTKVDHEVTEEEVAADGT